MSHGVVALFFGDDTAKKAGRLTLNPIKHVDPFGTVILPAMMLFATGAAFGYAKPVPVSPRQLRNPREHSLLVSLAGPATNIVLAVAAGLIMRSAFRDDLFSTAVVPTVVFGVGVINVVLAAFNLIPLPPLDGSAVIERFLPAAWWPRWARLRQYSMGLILIVVRVLPNALNRVFDAALRLWAHLL